MMHLLHFLRRAFAYVTRSRQDDELREEIAAHIELRRLSLIDDGMDPREAAWEARRMFGNVTVIREETRDMRTLRWLDTLGQDLRYGLRLLGRSPVFTASAIGSLALGIGAAAAVFSLADSLLVRRLPVRAPGELVLLRWISGPQAAFEMLNGNGSQNENEWSSTSFSRVAYDTMRREMAPDVDLFAFADLYRANLAVDGKPESARGQIVSGNYFEVLGLSPAAGRLLGPGDDQPNAPPAAVLGHDIWVRRFGGSHDVVGRTLVLNGVSFTIAGVLPRGFNGTMQVAQPNDVIVPMSSYAAVTHFEGNPNDPNYWWVLMMGRLKPGAPIDRVQLAADTILKRTVSSAKPDLKTDALPRVRVEPGDRGQTETREALFEPLKIMAAVVAVVLLVACANVANLLLARGKARARELAVRAAIGAPRRRLVRQMLTEGLLLGFCASALGLLIAGWINSALVPALAVDTDGLAVEFALDWRMLAFTCLLAVTCSVGFSLAPAVRSSDAHITTGLRESTRGGVGSRRRFSATGTLVVAQVALSMLLVSAAGLLTWSARNLQRTDTGFDPKNLLTFSVDTSLNGYSETRSLTFVETALERLRALPGVHGASVSSHRLIANSSSIGMARAAGEPAPPPGSPEAPGWAQRHRAYRLNVDDRFLETMKIPLLRGRSFSSADTETSPQVAIVNVAMATQLFGTADAVGRRFIMGLRPGNPEVEVIGVAANALYTSVRRPNLPIAYLPLRQQGLSSVTFAVRTAAEPFLSTSAVRETLRGLDDTLPIFDIRSQEEQIVRSLERERLFARLAMVLGAVTLVLSGIGVYGLLAYAVTRRTPEIGVRMALGAERRSVRWMILRQSLVLVGIGLALGIPAAAASTRLVESLLFGLGPRDPTVLAAAACVMLAVGLAAAYVPARRASRIDPLVALRAE